jgi:hypothetical protein
MPTIGSGTLCDETCNKQVKFDANKSSTFVDGVEEYYISFATGVGVDPVVDENWYLIIHAGNDVVSVGGISVPNVDLYLITYQTPTFSPDPFSGIQGATRMDTPSIHVRSTTSMIRFIIFSPRPVLWAGGPRPAFTFQLLSYAKGCG